MSQQIPIDFKMQVSGDSEVRSKMDKTSESADNLAESGEKVAKSGTNAFQSYSKAAGGFSLAAASVTSLFFQYDNLEKSQQRVDKAQVSLQQSNITLQGAQISLDKLVNKGITSGAEYERALANVQKAQSDLAVKTKDVQIAQGDMTQAQLSFALGVVPTVTSAITGVNTAMAALRTIQGASTVAQGASSAASIVDTGAKGAQAAATGAAATATGGLTLATKLLHLAMGPVGIAILGVSTFMALFATNAFGIRDAINAAGKAIGDALPILRPLLDMLAGAASALFPEAKAQAQDFGALTSDSLAKVSAQYPELSTASQLSTEQVGANYDLMAAKAGEMQELTTSSLGLMTEDVGTSVTTQKASFTDLGKAAVQMGNVVAQSFDKAATAAQRAAKKIVEAARDAARAMSSLGVSNVGVSTSSIRTAANGMHETVHGPTLVLAGEAGPERIDIAPVGSAGPGGGSSNITIHTHVNLDGEEVARNVSKHQARGL